MSTPVLFFFSNKESRRFSLVCSNKKKQNLRPKLNELQWMVESVYGIQQRTGSCNGIV